MAIGLTMIFFVFSLIESLWLLRCIKIKFKNQYFIAIGMAVLFVVLMALNGKVEFKNMCAIASIIAFVITLLITDSKMISKLECTVLVVLMKSCVILSVETWYIDGVWLSVGKEYMESFICFLSEFVMIIIFGYILKMILDILNVEKKIKAAERLDYVFLIGCFDIFICIFFIYKLIQTSYFKGFFVKTITSFAGISLLLVEIDILYKKWLTVRVQNYAKAEHELNEMQKNYYLSLLEKETDTKKYRHDMNNHIICIKSFIDEGKYEELNKYIDNLYDQTISLVNKGFHTGNSIIDALTNYYVENLNPEIEINLEGKIVKELKIDDIALSSVYSNMIVNAIEAQKFIPDEKRKYINVTLKEGKKYAQIIVKNTMQYERIENTDNIETIKDDKENHGFGLANIRKRLDENHGNLDIEAKDYEFCIKATLPLVSAEA